MSTNIRGRGLREKRLYGLNPLPAGLTKRELAKRADLPSLPQGTLQDPFHIVWKHGTGLEAEELDFFPSTPETAKELCWELRESEARDLMREKEELGMIVVEEPSDLREVITKSIVGLGKAFQHYDEAGMQSLNDLQMKQSWDDTKLKQNRAMTWPMLLNAQAALAISQQITALEEQLIELPFEEAPRPRAKGVRRGAESTTAA
jgi:hypothetical protein